MEMPNFDKTNPGDESGSVLDLEKQEKEINVSRINPEDLGSIKEYYQFEIDNDFSELAEKDSLKDMAEYRKGQMEKGELVVSWAQKENKIVSTTVVVLKNGTMGKKIEEDEAFAAGTVVDSELRGVGIGEKMSQEQDKIAQEAGKKFIVTVIDDNNYSSMRLRMKVGYSLAGVHKKKENQPVEYKYKKNLENQNLKSKEYWLKESKAKNIGLAPDNLEKDSARQILINPEDIEQVEKALKLGYQGVFLLKPEEHNKSEQNLMLFEKELEIESLKS